MSSRSLDWDYEEKPIYSIPTLGQVHTGGVVKVYATFKMRDRERERIYYHVNTLLIAFYMGFLYERR